MNRLVSYLAAGRPGLKAGLVMLVVFVMIGRANADNEVYRRTLRASVWVINGNVTGSGVVIDVEKKWILTNEHVVGTKRNVSVFFPAYRERGFHAERSYYLERATELSVPGRVLATDRDRDLALVELETLPSEAEAVELGEPAEPGDDVHSIGNPGSSDALWIYTSGTVRANYHRRFEDQRVRDMQVLETNAPINLGDSGGPVVNDDGHLVGLVQSMKTDARLVSLCVDVSEIKAFLTSEHSFTDAVMDAWNAPLSNRDDDVPPRQFEYEVDGDVVTVNLSQKIESYGAVEVRRVWVVARQMSVDEGQAVMSELLQQNAKTKLGSWSLESAADGFTLIYVARLSPDLAEAAVRDAIDYVSRIVQNER